MIKNWRTTILGLAAGGLQLFAAGTDWRHILLAIATGALGAVAGDAVNTPPSR